VDESEHTKAHVTLQWGISHFGEAEDLLLIGLTIVPRMLRCIGKDEQSSGRPQASTTDRSIPAPFTPPRSKCMVVVGACLGSGTVRERCLDNDVFSDLQDISLTSVFHMSVIMNLKGRTRLMNRPVGEWV
jgi:hypothetical protein